MRRRALLGAAAATLALPVRAQVTTLDLRPASFSTRPDDWVAPSLDRRMLIRWGDRVAYDAPDWDPRDPTPEAAGAQFGWDGRLAGTVAPPPAGDGVPRLVVAVAHPRVDPAFAFPGGRDRPAVAAAMQGASLLNLQRAGGEWLVVDGGFQSRRLDAATLCRWSGPGAAAEVAQGILGPEGGCATPWRSLLLAEGDPTDWLARLRELDPRFRDAARFGWVVELDPLDPQSVPVKRAALGRVGASAVLAMQSGDGRAVVLMADGGAGGFLYRFVSSRPAEEPDALDAGALFVARTEGGAIRWLPLPAGGTLDPAGAAERAGGTRFDTPTALAADPRRPRIYLACRAGTTRGAAQVDVLNPRPGPNPGHVIELIGDAAAERMEARLLFVAGDTAEGGRYGRDQPITAFPRHPATLAVDGQGRLWVGTDRGGRLGPQPDAVFAGDLDGPGRAVLLPAYGAPRGAGIGGVMPTPDRDALLVMVRTPGSEPGASFAAPATRWPAFDPALPPRSALVTLARRAGGPIGG